jgi:hypothetical protein
MAQVVSRLPLTTEAGVRHGFSTCEICCGQSVTRSVFFPSFSALSSQCHSTVAPHSCIIWGMNNKPAGGCNTDSRTAST